MSDEFELSWTFSDYAEGNGRVASLVPFPTSRDVIGWIHTRHVEVPEPVFFQVYFDEMGATCPDYPSNNKRWPIMSRRMLDVLLSVGEFPHRVIPIVLLDDRAIDQAPAYERDWQPRAGTFREGYFAVQLLEHVDGIDWEQSAYEPLSGDDDPAAPWSMTKLVLAPPTTGFPPIFRVAQTAGTLFVSSAGHDAMVAAGVQGPRYIPMGKVIPGSVVVPPEWRNKRP